MLASKEERKSPQSPNTTVASGGRETTEMEKCKAEGVSPLATVEEIRRRLVRPPSLHPQPSISSTRARQEDITSRDSSQFDVNSREVADKRIEDYLDPVLLSAIRSKIGGKRKRSGEMMRVKKEVEFEWPVDELKVLTDGLRSEKGMKWRLNEAVDLGDDVDVIRGIGDEDEEVSCTPFRRFERTALKWFNGCEG